MYSYLELRINRYKLQEIPDQQKIGKVEKFLDWKAEHSIKNCIFLFFSFLKMVFANMASQHFFQEQRWHTSVKMN